MYILDTNVVSELRKTMSGRAEPAVVRWSNSTTAAELYLSAVAVFEIEMGILKLARRNDEQAARLKAWFRDDVLPAFSGKVLPIDEDVATTFAGMMVPKTRPYRDTLVAATAKHHGYTVVTRNIRDFAELPVSVIDPWDFS
jgi:predicted nucleic acid-binding protein